MGEFFLAKYHLEMALSRYDRDRDRVLAVRYAGVDAGANCLSYSGMTLWQLGFPDQALARANEAVALAQALSDSHILAGAEYFLCNVLHFRREAPEVRERAESVILLSAERGLTLWSALGNAIRGWAVAKKGPAEEGIALIEQGLAAYRATGAQIGWSYQLCLLAEALIMADRLDDALRALVEAHAEANRHNEHNWDAEVQRLKGELLLRQDASNRWEAQSCFEFAIDTARKQGAKSLELRATTSLGLLLAKEDRREEARTLLADIYNWFTEGFDTADLKDAKAMLDELGA
jgi:predicted ATPase